MLGLLIVQHLDGDWYVYGILTHSASNLAGKDFAPNSSMNIKTTSENDMVVAFNMLKGLVGLHEIVF